MLGYFSDFLGFRVVRLFVNNEEVKCLRFNLIDSRTRGVEWLGDFDRIKIWLDENYSMEFTIRSWTLRVDRDSYEVEFWVESIEDFML